MHYKQFHILSDLKNRSELSFTETSVHVVPYIKCLSDDKLRTLFWNKMQEERKN